MFCKDCGCKTIVIDRVNNPDYDESYRCRVCPKCGQIFYTCEFPVITTKKFKRDWVIHHKFHKKPVDKAYVNPTEFQILLAKSHKNKTKNK